MPANHPPVDDPDIELEFDEDLEIWDQFVTAVRWLRRVGARPELTLQTATREALLAWVGEQSTLFHDDQAFHATRVSMARSSVSASTSCPPAAVDAATEAELPR